MYGEMKCGAFISALLGIMLLVLTLLSGTVHPVFAQETGQVARTIAWSPDGQQIAVGGTFGIRLYSTTLKSFTLLSGANVAFVAWSSDNRRLASADFDRTVRIWDTASGKLLLDLQGHTDQIWSVAWSPDSARIASAGKDKTLRVWDAQTGDLLTVLPQSEQTWSMAWSPDGTRIASGGGDLNTGAGTFIQLWDAVSYVPRLSFDLTHVPAGAVTFLSWRPDSAQLASAAGNVETWDAHTGELLLFVNTAPFTSAGWSPDGRFFIMTDVICDIIIRYVATGTFTPDLRGHQTSVVAATWNPDSRELASISEDGTLRKWDVTTGQQLALTILPSIDLSALQFAIRVCTPDEDTRSALKEYLDGNQLNAFIREVNRSVPAAIDPQCADHLIQAATYLLNQVLAPR
jgi:WD40 repeat protein